MRFLGMALALTVLGACSGDFGLIPEARLSARAATAAPTTAAPLP